MLRKISRLVVLLVAPALAVYALPATAAVVKPKLTIDGPTDVDVDQRVRYHGTLTLPGPDRRKEVDLVVDGRTLATDVTNDDGEYAVWITFSETGTYDVQAVFKKRAESRVLDVAVGEPDPEPTPTPTEEPTPPPSPTPTEEPTPSPTPTPGPTPEPSPTPTGEPTPTPHPTAEPTPTPTPEPEFPAPEPPPSEEQATTDFAESSEFLYSGEDPVQVGVQEEELDEERAAILRGRVDDRGGAALSGVKVHVVDHPEYGHTFTRGDGLFDMVVNGGQPLVVRYEKDGFLTVEREIAVPVLDYEFAADVVMLPFDDVVTEIDVSDATTLQVAQGSEVTDAEGTRQATLLFQPETSATMVLPDGSTELLPEISVRATEFTVGESGDEAMPGALPSTSAYTYAVEYSIDEAEAVGATEIEFSEAVVTYTDNFLDFPVGTPVPTGYYDRETHSWVAADDGIVVKILDAGDGVAALDTDGDGMADDQAPLDMLGVTPDELQRVAALYETGQTFWRVPIQHFTPWDHNWPYGPPGGARRNGEMATEEELAGQCAESGSIIGCENQTLGETIPISGTPYQLGYDTSLMPGYEAGRSLRIPLTNANLPPLIKGVTLDVTVAGRRFSESFEPQANLVHTFVWDGRDAYGRRAYGSQVASIRVGYVYEAVYYAPSEFGRSFGEVGSGPIEGNRARREITLYQEYETRIGNVTGTASTPVGGWSVDVHHAYDAQDGTLYLGTGAQQRPEVMSLSIAPFAGSGAAGPLEEGTYSGDGSSAKAAGLSEMRGIATGADGSVYVADTGNGVVRKIDPQGVISTIAGGGSPAGNGDGGQATAAELIFPTDVAVAPDGSIYVLDSGAADVRKVSTDGTISTVAGGGVDGLGDGGPAVQAELTSPSGIAVGAQNTLYIADTGANRIRRVTADGTISTIAGGGASALGIGDGGPATAASLARPTDVAVATDGTLYVADSRHRRIRMISPEGTITTLAGNGQTGTAREGAAAAGSAIGRPAGIAVDPTNGSVYFAERTKNRVAEVTADGRLVTLAGSGRAGSSGNGGAPAAARLDTPLSVAVAPDGKILVADSGNYQVRRILGVMPGFGSGDIVIPASSGAEVYHFDSTGRHLRTLDGLTGTVLYRFSYDGVGRLTGISDSYDNLTTIERDAAGAPQAIVSPFGTSTTLEVGPDGYLARVVNAADEAIDLTYEDGGLLATLTAAGATHAYTYDDLGRLIKDEGPDGRSVTLERRRLPNGHAVVTTTTEGRTTTYAVTREADGSQRRTVTDAAGGVSSVTVRRDGTIVSEESDGTRSEARVGADPRWGMTTPVAASQTTTLPSGKTSTVETSKEVVLTDAANPLVIARQTEKVVSNGKTSTRTFDASNRTITARSAGGREAVLTLDGRGRVVAMRTGTLAPVAISYDERGRVESLTRGTGDDARSASLTYDAFGFVETSTDAAGKTTVHVRDEVGRPTSTSFEGLPGASFGFDAAGNLSSVVPPDGDAHALEYTKNDLLSSYRPPSGEATTYAYDADLQLSEIDQPGPGRVGFRYDASGRLQERTFGRGSVQYDYLPKGFQVESVAGPDGEATSYAYDGPLVRSIRTAPADTRPLSTTWTYDADLRIVSRQIEGGPRVEFGYENDGLVSSAGPLGMTWRPGDALPSTTTLGAVASSHGWNEFGERISDVYTTGAGTVYSLEVTRDDLGRVATSREVVQGASTTFGFSYDERHRLSEVTKDGATWRSYTYDANGNRLTASEDGAGPLPASYDVQDRLSSYGDTTYTYNASGQLASKTTGGETTTYDYDEFGSLRGVGLPGKNVTYLVDGSGRRVARKVDGTTTNRYLYGQGPHPVAELDDAGGIKQQFVYATKPHVPDVILRNGVAYRLIHDQIGSVRMVVDSSTGEIVQRIDYDPFGKVINDTNPGFQPFGFAGGLYDGDTGLVRFGSRDYDPASGRWTSRDPILFEGGDANLFAYVGGDPVNSIDPSGLLSCDLPDAYYEIEQTMSYYDCQAQNGLENPNAVVGFFQWAGSKALGGALDIGGLDTVETSAETLAMPCKSAWDKIKAGGSIVLVGVSWYGAASTKVMGSSRIFGSEARHGGRLIGLRNRWGPKFYTNKHGFFFAIDKKPHFFHIFKWSPF